MSDSKPNIYQRLLAVQKACEYVKRDTVPKAGDGVRRDVVVATVRQHLIANGVLVSTSQVGPGRLLVDGKTSSSGTDMVCYCAMYATTFQNVDDPADRHIVQHEGQGNDYSDKAPGKASTYAEKLNLVKGCFLETGINEESRNPGEYGPEDTDTPAAPAKNAPIAEPKAASATTAAAPTDAPVSAPAPAGEAPAPAPAAKTDEPLAAAGLVKQIKIACEAKKQTEAVTAKLALSGLTLDTMPKSVAAKVWQSLLKIPLPAEEPPEPGSNG